TETLGNQGLMEGRHLTLTSRTIDNTDGEISATGRLVVTVEDYDHQGEVQAGDLTLASAGDIRLGADVEWKLAGEASLSAAAEFNNAGILSSADNLVLQAAVIDNQGSLAARIDLNVT